MKQLLLLCLVGWMAGCAQPTQPTAGTPLEPRSLSSQETRSDDSISSEVRRRLSAEGAELSSVLVSVNGGVVTLNGVVPSTRAAYRAEAAARAVAGVTAVQNSVLINSPAY